MYDELIYMEFVQFEPSAYQPSRYKIFIYSYTYFLCIVDMKYD